MSAWMSDMTTFIPSRNFYLYVGELAPIFVLFCFTKISYNLIGVAKLCTYIISMNDDQGSDRNQASAVKLF